MMQHSKGHYVHNTRITNIYSLGNYIIIVNSRTTFKSYHLSKEDPILTLRGSHGLKLNMCHV